MLSLQEALEEHKCIVLLAIGVGATPAGGVRLRMATSPDVVELLEQYRCFYTTGYDRDWELVEMRLKKLIWCEHVMKEKMYRFWQACQI